MPKLDNVRDVSPERARAERLRDMARRSRVVGNRSLRDLCKRGRILEEAAALSKGSFGSWCRSECRIEPRTAYGYRKAFLVLGNRLDWLVERQVSPSVVVILACARPSGRDAALEAIASGRFLTASEARRIVRGHADPTRRTPTGIAGLKTAARIRTNEFVAAVEALVAQIAGQIDCDIELAAAAADAGQMLPMAHLLFPLSACNSEGRRETPPVISALRRFATAAGNEARHAAALDLTELSSVASLHAPAPPSAATVGHLTAIEICAGAGGQALGLSEAGFRHLAMVERDPHACETLRSAFGAEHVVEGDLVRYVPSPDEVGPLDLIAGGAPCQPFSKLGRMEGGEDDRDLLPEAIRLVETLKPRAVMLENVNGIFAPNFDIYRLSILRRLERAGYTCEWRTLDATHFGVPQRRIRSFLVAFQEPEAMARFSWPRAVEGYEIRPQSVFEALEQHFRAGGWDPTSAFRKGMDRAAPTLTGASDRKAGFDFGQRNAAGVWGRMGFVTSRLGDMPPTAGHEGPVLATNAMLAAIQGFPDGYPFQGPKLRIAKQIANALPAAVALHLGRAIAVALAPDVGITVYKGTTGRATPLSR